jgi:hypothetical protein
MASRSNLGGPGGVEIKIDGDTTPLENKITEAKAKVEAADVTGKVSEATEQLAEKTERVAEAGEQAFGPSGPVQSGLKGVNKTLGDTVGQVQALLGKLAMVVGTATGMYALGQAIRESVVKALETGTERAEKFKDSIDFTNPTQSLKEYDKQIAEVSEKLEQATKQAQYLASPEYLSQLGSRGSVASVLAEGYGTVLDNIKKLKDEQQKLIEDSKPTRDFVQAETLRKGAEATQKKLDAEQAALDKTVAEELRAQEKIQQARDKADREEDERSRNEDSRRKERIRAIGDEMKAQEDLADRVAEYQRRQREAAERTKQAWVDSFTAIKAASNDVFGNNRAVSDAGMAGVVSSIGTRSAANNRVVFEGGN